MLKNINNWSSFAFIAPLEKDFSMFKMCKYDWKSKTLLGNDYTLAGKDYLKFAGRLRQIGLDNGIECNQSHAPFPTYAPEIRAHYKRAIECTAEAGGKICIIHPDNYKSAEENAEISGASSFCKILRGRKIATENMWNWNDELNQATPAA